MPTTLKLCAILALASLAACGGKGDEIASEMESIATQACECKNADCTEKLGEKRDALRKKSRETFKKKEDVPEALLERLKKADKKYRECRDKVEEGNVVAELTALTDNMCKCKDKACSEKVNDEFDAWMKRNSSSKGSEAVQQKVMKLAEKYSKCMIDAMSNG